MDKFRALQYFISAAQEGSFSGAARRLEVSVPAVAKLIGSLERSLGASLFDRSVHGLTLTADGQRYREACQPLLDELAAADQALAGVEAGSSGTVVVGAPPHIAQHCILPALPGLHARYPDLQIDLRGISRPSDADGGAVDVFVVLGWPDGADLVHRRLATTRVLACAAPAYWAAHGVPVRPQDLRKHACLLFRNPEGTVIDLWQYERNGQAESVAVRGWLISNHRDVILDAVLSGEGVARLTDLSVRAQISGGLLVPVLLDWEMQDAPPVNLLYRPNHRDIPRVRVVIDFVTRLFRELEDERNLGAGPACSMDRPYWHLRHHGRASAVPRKRL
ncbi:MAG TPA: LysR substrate-binding domain-containing protein [Accumulibacter sp.]|uniref:LysR family transcriptional regulator n=1 Tax=Accumulibacter sp. TaxID=2053492 RepID=UPI00262D87DB|nr:LysR family transcriptional regulator [Accumulibacter sp.]HRD93141.1 LysR substrate-binding domain-containing protein [Accumulibacter sp.]HRF71998.1 LysR substrate-binding domain-containing protein [Accumulibacter sp.]